MNKLRRWEIPHHTNQKPNATGITGQGLHTGSMSFLSPNQQHQSNEGMHVHKKKIWHRLRSIEREHISFDACSQRL